MKYFLAFVIAVVLVVGMLAFQRQMAIQMIAWENANARLSDSQRLQGFVAEAIAAYWYLFATLIAGVCIGAAALLPKRCSEIQTTDKIF